MSDPRPPDDPGDDLIERYRRASAADPSRPSAHVRESILAHARELAASRAGASALQRLVRTGSAANEPNWTLRLAGTLAVAGIAGLLLIPFLHLGSEGDRARQTPATVAVSPAGAPETTTDRLAVAASAAKPEATAAGGAIDATDQAAAPAAKRGAAPSAGRAELAQTAAPAQKAASAESAAPAPTAASAQLAAPAPAAGPAPERSMAGARAARAPTMPVAVEAVPVLLQAAQSGDIGLVKSSLERGVSLEMTDSLGRTALMLATIHGHANVVRVLLDAGANVDAADRAGATPLERARTQQLPEIARLL
jgi:hypothetical protein